MYLEYFQYDEGHGNRTEGNQTKCGVCMEKEIDDLKSTVLMIFDKAATEESYSAVVMENLPEPPLTFLGQRTKASVTV